MEITRNNYESFFLDSLEGNLTAAQQKELQIFMRNNPDLEMEYFEFQNVALQPEEAIFEAKNLLKKNETLLTDSPFADLCIARLESDITAEQNVELHTFIQKNPEFQKEADLFAKTKLVPDLAVKFPYKRKLYHQKTILFSTKNVLKTLSIAASLLLLVSIAFLFSEKNTTTEKLIGFNEKNISVPIFVENNITETENIIETKQNVRKNVFVENNNVATNFNGDTLNEEVNIFEENQIQIAENHNVEIPKANIDSLMNQYHNTLNELLSTQNQVADNEPSLKKNSQETILLMQNLVKTFITNQEVETPVTVWQIAQNGIDRINNFSGTNMELTPSYNENGKVVSIAFNSRLLAFEREINRNK